MAVLGHRNEDATDSSDPDDTRSSSGATPGDPKETPVRFVSGSEFSPAKASQHIALISLLGMPTSLTPRDKLAYLSHLIDSDAEAAFRAIGGLLGFMLSEDIVNSLERPDEPIRFLALRQSNFAASMYMSRATQRALQVFELDAHPLGHGSGAAKEGLSLYGVLGRTRCPVGGKLMRTWIAAPSTDLDVILERQEMISLLRAPAQDAAFAALCDALRGVKNIPSILTRLQTITAGINDWQGLSKSGRAFLAMHDALSSLENESMSKKFLVRFDPAPLRDAVNWIASVLDFPESKAAGRLIVLPGFSEDIDAMRECYAGLDDFLTRVGVQEMNRIVAETSLRVPRLQIVYLPQVGYLVLLDHDFLSGEEASDEALASGGLEFMFSSPEHGGYFKNEQCYCLDVELGDVHGALTDLEAKAVRYLETKVLPAASAFYEASCAAAELDCLVALAEAANEHNWVRPEFDGDSDYHGLVINQGRHALQELIIPSYIPNDLNAKGGNVHVITGPNCSGKSVFCKQVALIVVLAHIGSCVPAQSCKTGIIDVIFTRIASNESVSLNQSSFFIDASQVASMLQSANQSSLVLLDEWGKGTNETDGMALFAATLTELLRRPAGKAPICLAATHFTELLTNAFLPMESARLGIFSMDVLVENEDEVGDEIKNRERRDRIGQLDDKTVYLYRIVAGSTCGESRALHSAQAAGVPRDVLVRSIEVRSAVQAGGSLPPAAIELNGRPARIPQIIASVRSFLETDLSDPEFDVRGYLSSLPL
jgi:DNA mismatch repair protein MSH5